MAGRPTFTLVLSGGGLKGLAHIGVLRALEERRLRPALVVGSSMGSLIAGAYAAGMRLREMEDRALALRRRDVFRIAHVDMALRRMLSPAVYRRDPLDRILQDLVGTRTFDDLDHRLVVNTVDLNTGHQVLWGMPGLTDVRVADAIFASCALPGIFPPRRIRGHVCADGAVVDNLPVRVAAALGGGPVVAVDLGGGHAHRRGVERTGFASTYGRGLELVMGRLGDAALHHWTGPPLVLIRPAIENVAMFAFNKTPFLIAEGYRATLEAFDRLPAPLDALAPGIHPKFLAGLTVDPALCIGCGLCAAAHPDLFRMRDGKAESLEPGREWTPRNDAAVRMCPVGAIRTGGPGARPPRAPG
jgi:NTE family protein